MHLAPLAPALAFANPAAQADPCGAGDITAVLMQAALPAYQPTGATAHFLCSPNQVPYALVGSLQLPTSLQTLDGIGAMVCTQPHPGLCPQPFDAPQASLVGFGLALLVGLPLATTVAQRLQASWQRTGGAAAWQSAALQAAHRLGDSLAAACGRLGSPRPAADVPAPRPQLASSALPPSQARPAPAGSAAPAVLTAPPAAQTAESEADPEPDWVQVERS